MPTTVFERLVERLEARSVCFEILRHRPVFTSEEAAQVRGTSLASGAKALVCKADSRFLMFVLPANRRLDSKLARRAERFRRFRFANHQEVADLTGLEPGSIPPFGSLFSLPTWCDEKLGEQARINFNAGDHAISISMNYAEYLSIEQPRIESFTS